MAKIRPKKNDFLLHEFNNIVWWFLIVRGIWPKCVNNIYPEAARIHYLSNILIYNNKLDTLFSILIHASFR